MNVSTDVGEIIERVDEDDTSNCYQQQLDSPARLYRLYCAVQCIMPCCW